MAISNYKKYPVFSPVRVVSTTNLSGTYYNGPLNNGVEATLTLSAGALTIDSVSLKQGDSILVNGQTAANQNGIYELMNQPGTGISLILRRRDDLQCTEQFNPGFFVSVGAGTTNGGAIYTLVEPIPAQFGISNITFTKV